MNAREVTIAAARPWFPEEDVAAAAAEIASVLRSGRLIFGPHLRALEADFARRVGVRHAVAVSSCSAALEIAYRYVGVKGREVIVPTNTFAATASAAIAAGARPVFCDMNPQDFCLDAEDALSRITPRTAAIVVVHLAGFVAPIERLREKCAALGVALIEDCAHAHGARLRGRSAGSLGLAGCFSFYSTKILTCGVGGMLTTDDDALAGFARSLRHHGQGDTIEEILRPGNDWVLDEVRCVIARRQLMRLDEILARRRALVTRYTTLLARDDHARIAHPAWGTEPAWYKYPIVLQEGVDRDEVRRLLRERHGIEAGALYWPPCHLMPAFQGLPGTGPGALPVAEEWLARQLTLPLHAGLAPDDATRVVTALTELLTAPSVAR